jgi:penicillin-insensitive murein endopeptidase
MAHTRWLLLIGLLGACSAPPRRGPPDRMVFADDPEDDAIEAVPRARVRLQRPERMASGRPGSARPGLATTPMQPPPARCVGPHENVARSVGSTNDGRLEDGCRIAPQGPGYVAVGERAWGTDEMVAWLQWAAAQVATQFPGSAPLVVGALSAEQGGFIRPHKSHQSGRDVDLGYFHTVRSQARRFELTTASNIDAEKTWALIEALLVTGEVSFVFMDYDIQAVIYDALIDEGWPEQALEPIFQYPSPVNVAKGLIRHAKGHADHFHVRFRCAARDTGCLD